MSRLWNRLARPWSRGVIILVTAAVTATAVYLVVRSQDADVDEPPVLVEESWVEERLVEVEPPPPGSPLDQVEVPIPDDVEQAGTLTVFEPPSSGWTWDMTALPAGRYEVHAGCGFVDPRVEEYGGRVMIHLWHGEQHDEESESFTIECGEPMEPTGHELESEADIAISASGGLSRLDVEIMDPDEYLVRIDGELVNAAYVAVVVFVPILE